MDFSIISMTVEGQSQPLAIDTLRPYFGWKLEAKEKGLLQQAYRIQVFLQDEELWDSGRVQSDIMYAVEYQGAALEAETEYTWLLTVENQLGEKAEAQSTFETSLMDTTEAAWKGAKWIGNNHELPLCAHYLPVFKMECQLAIAEGSTRAGFLWGGDDPRLMDKNKNLMEVEVKPGKAYCGIELDISDLPSGGKAKVRAKRAGFTAQDDFTKPLYEKEISLDIINIDNCHDSHTIYMDVEYAQFDLYIDARDQAHWMTAPEPGQEHVMPPVNKWNMNPAGRGGDYICYPQLGKIGLLLEPGQEADFKKLEVKNYRQPCNVLYSGIPEAKNKLVEISHGGNTILRKAFSLNKKVKKARAYVTARGIYDLYVNGKKVGDEYFAPGLSQYNRHHYYQCYDLTQYLQQEDNCIGAVLAEGWWAGAISYTGSNWNYWGDRTSLLARLVITYEDGSVEDIVSDDSWQMRNDGMVVEASFFQGEIRDMRREGLQQDFTLPGKEPEGWEKAEIVPLAETTAALDAPLHNGPFMTAPMSFDNIQLMASQGDGVHAIDCLTAVALSQPRPGVYIYDMGQNLAGLPLIDIEGREGQHIQLRFAEVLYPQLEEFAGKEGTMMLENIRGAMASDQYILRDGRQTLTASFTYHGYRYLEITGIEEALPLESVKSLALSCFDGKKATFECSDDRINQLYSNIGWSFKNNTISVPTDCPQRNERMAWSGDLSVFGPTMAYMADGDNFLRRQLLALMDTQVNGRFADIAPVGGGFGGILWGSVGITVPWEIYLNYKDTRALETIYPAMADYMAYLETRKNDQGLIEEGPLGDWLGPELSRNDNLYLWQSYYVYDLKLMWQMAQLLGKPEADDWGKKYDKAHEHYLRTFFDEEGHTIFSSEETALNFDMFFHKIPKQVQPAKNAKDQYLLDTQTSYAVAIGLGLIDGDLKDKAGKHLKAAVERATTTDDGRPAIEYSLMTGFIGTARILPALTAVGNGQTAWRMLKNDCFPSWLFSVKNGATTIWERPDSYTKERGFGGNNSMNSFDHYSFGAVGSWMLEQAGGITRCQEPGQYQICPVIDKDGDVTYVKASVDTLRGRYSVSWKLTEEGVVYDIVIPAGKAAMAMLSGIKDSLEVELEPGSHTITVA